jgi:hypothetical protein
MSEKLDGMYLSIHHCETCDSIVYLYISDEYRKDAEAIGEEGNGIDCPLCNDHMIMEEAYLPRGKRP